MLDVTSYIKLAAFSGVRSWPENICITAAGSRQDILRISGK
jgi:hypothetical protein